MQTQRKILDRLVYEAIKGSYYTASGERVMLPLQALIDLGLASEETLTALRNALKRYYQDQETET